MTELAIREAHGVVVPDYRPAQVAERDVIDGWITVIGEVGKLADYISETDFVPKALRNRPAAIAAAILTGRELGIGPMQSLKSIHMVQGVPSLSAEYKRARALAAGHEIVFEETNATRCVVRGRRAGSDRWVTITWTMDMARRAKLDGKEVWRAYPQRLLQARASSELCDVLFPDASLGLGTTEIIEDGGIVTESGDTVDAATGELTTGTTPAIEAARPRTARRRQAAPDTSPAQAAPAATATPPAGAGEALPPLPGEDEDPTTSGASSSAHAPERGSQQRTAAPSPSTSNGSAAAPDDTDYDTPGTVTTPQITAIWTVLSKVYGFGNDEKDQARMVCAYVVGHDLSTTTMLTKNEAKGILDTLGHWREQAEKAAEHPRSYMIALMAAQDEAAESA
jgi:hypothetical protein